MKKLQNDSTTPEQAKQLLELGVPADSANFVYDCALIGGEKYYSLSILEDELFSVYKRMWENSCTDIIPCWSVGRLMEIINICVPSDEELAFTYYDDMIDGLIDRIKEERVDFSKLEE